MSLSVILSDISSQTNIRDMDEIERSYFRNNCNIADTIIDLMSYVPNKDNFKKTPKSTTVFHDIREILVEKEECFQRVMEAKRQPSTASS